MEILNQILSLFHPPLPPEEARAAPTTEPLPEHCHKIGSLMTGKSLWECEEKPSTPITDSVFDLAEGVAGIFGKGLSYYKDLLTHSRHGDPIPPRPSDPQLR